MITGRTGLKADWLPCARVHDKANLLQKLILEIGCVITNVCAEARDRRRALLDAIHYRIRNHIRVELERVVVVYAYKYESQQRDEIYSEKDDADNVDAIKHL